MTVSLIHTFNAAAATLHVLQFIFSLSHIFAKARDRNALHSPSTEIPMQPVCELSLTVTVLRTPSNQIAVRLDPIMLLLFFKALLHTTPQSPATNSVRV